MKRPASRSLSTGFGTLELNRKSFWRVLETRKQPPRTVLKMGLMLLLLLMMMMGYLPLRWLPIPISEPHSGRLLPIAAGGAFLFPRGKREQKLDSAFLSLPAAKGNYPICQLFCASNRARPKLVIFQTLIGRGRELHPKASPICAHLHTHRCDPWRKWAAIAI